MKDIVSLIEDGDTCGFCERPWDKCCCKELFEDDYWGDDTPDYDRREGPRYFDYYYDHRQG